MTTPAHNRSLDDFRLALGSANPEAMQRKVLLQRIVAPNVNCEFGRHHNFRAICSVRDFQQAVPVAPYEDFRPYIERIAQGEPEILTAENVSRFFVTSGSTSAPKYVPVTRSFVRDKWRAFQLFWNLLREAHPKAFTGNVITNFSDGSRETCTPAGILCGSESSFWNSWGKGPKCAVGNALPHDVCKIIDPGARYYAIARVLLEQNVSVMMALNPSTILLLLKTIQEHYSLLLRDIEYGGLNPTIPLVGEIREKLTRLFPGNPARARELADLASSASIRLPANRVWPYLEIVVCWRSPMLHPYLELLEDYLGSVPQRDYILMASEGVIAIPFEDSVSGGALATSTHFYEFIPEQLSDDPNPPTLLADELEIGKNYVVVLSTSSGLYRYNIGDVVRVRSFLDGTPVVEFLHRTGHTCSLTGEKLTEDQVAQAVSHIASQLALHLQGFTLCPDPDPFPHYVLAAEFVNTPASHVLRSFITEVDREIASSNLEYKSKRDSRRLGPPELWVARTGTYAALRQRRSRAGVSDAQIKLACLTRDLRFRDELDIAERIPCASAA